MGASFGDYDIVRELGRGGMGVVYLAHERPSGRAVALKVLPREVSTDPEYVRRFLAEGHLITTLRHPSIVEAYAVGQHHGRYFIAMEFVEGQSLSELLRLRKVLEVREALRITQAVASALATAHVQGIIHRDIKPHNIMVDKQGQVKVLDFGIARLSWDFGLGDQDERWTRNETGVGVEGAVGTLLYMSPEQLRGDPVDARTDIYSLGVTLYEMLAGKPPYQGQAAIELIYRITQGGPEDIRKRNRRVPLSVATLVNKMISARPSSRPRTSNEVARSVQDVLTDYSPIGRIMRHTAAGVNRILASCVEGVSAAKEFLSFRPGITVAILSLIALLVFLAPMRASVSVIQTNLATFNAKLYPDKYWSGQGSTNISVLSRRNFSERSLFSQGLVVEGGPLNGYVQGLLHKSDNRFRIHCKCAGHSRLTIHISRLASSAMVYVFASGVQIGEVVLPSQGQEQIKDNPYDKTLAFDLPEGFQEIEVINNGKDWFYVDLVQLDRLLPVDSLAEFPPLSDSKPTPALSTKALQTDAAATVAFSGSTWSYEDSVVRLEAGGIVMLTSPDYPGTIQQGTWQIRNSVMTVFALGKTHRFDVDGDRLLEGGKPISRIQ